MESGPLKFIRELLVYVSFQIQNSHKWPENVQYACLDLPSHFTQMTWKTSIPMWNTTQISKPMKHTANTLHTYIGICRKSGKAYWGFPPSLFQQYMSTSVLLCLFLCPFMHIDRQRGTLKYNLLHRETGSSYLNQLCYLLHKKPNELRIHM